MDVYGAKRHAQNVSPQTTECWRNKDTRQKNDMSAVAPSTDGHCSRNCNALTGHVYLGHGRHVQALVHPTALDAFTLTLLNRKITKQKQFSRN